MRLPQEQQGWKYICECIIYTPWWMRRQQELSSAFIYTCVCCACTLLALGAARRREKYTQPGEKWVYVYMYWLYDSRKARGERCFRRSARVDMQKPCSASSFFIPTRPDEQCASSLCNAALVYFCKHPHNTPGRFGTALVNALMKYSSCLGKAHGRKPWICK